MRLTAKGRLFSDRQWGYCFPPVLRQRRCSHLSAAPGASLWRILRSCRSTDVRYEMAESSRGHKPETNIIRYPVSVFVAQRGREQSATLIHHVIAHLFG